MLEVAYYFDVVRQILRQYHDDQDFGKLCGLNRKELSIDPALCAEANLSDAQQDRQYDDYKDV